MQDFIIVTGMILKQTPIGEYDRRICLLTKERGKIAAFVKGSRKPGSRLSSATNPFSFGTFKLYEGRSSYNVSDAEIQNYFEPLRTDYIGAYYGMYFAEIADYYTRENNDERQMLKLLYQSLRALCAPSIPNELVRYIYEIKSIAVNGEFPGVRRDRGPQPQLLESTVYTLEYIVSSSVEKLYTFTVTPSVLAQLGEEAEWYCDKIIGHEFKSLEILKSLC
ncbi:MAG: DNA repair protein RecO [Lachnospiraceae bacterium]|nr:DNA repair protein RecO [Lachnospiraceae bacterium]